MICHFYCSHPHRFLNHLLVEIIHRHARIQHHSLGIAAPNAVQSRQPWLLCRVFILGNRVGQESGRAGRGRWRAWKVMVGWSRFEQLNFRGQFLNLHSSSNIYLSGIFNQTTKRTLKDAANFPKLSTVTPKFFSTMFGTASRPYQKRELLSSQ